MAAYAQEAGEPFFRRTGIKGMTEGAGKCLGDNISIVAGVLEDTDTYITGTQSEKQEVKDKIKKLGADLLNVFAHPIKTLEGFGNLIYETTKEKGIAYTAGYLGTELMSGAAIAQVGKLGKVGKLSGVADDIVDVSKAGKIVNKDRKLGQIIEKWYSKGKSTGSKKAVGKGGRNTAATIDYSYKI